MNKDPQELFREAWEQAKRRINVGKRNKDRVRFFLIDGTTKTFDIPPMRDDSMKEEFLEITLVSLNNHPVEAILLTYEAWFVDEKSKVALRGLDAYLQHNPRPRNHPQKREGVHFYYESSDGVILSTLAEIITVRKGKRELDGLSEAVQVDVESPMSHLFKKAHEYSETHKNPLDSFFGKN